MYAAGMTLKKEKLFGFKDAFEKQVRRRSNLTYVDSEIEIDAGKWVAVRERRTRKR
jgi:hypothetical protein